MKNILLTTIFSLLVCTVLVSHTRAGAEDLIFFNGFEAIEVIESCSGGEILFSETFADGNHNTWGGDWLLPGFEVGIEEIVDGQARFLPLSSDYSLARIIHPLQVQDVDVTFTLYFENAETQRIGFIVRGNGGYLNQTSPTGEGYAVFIEKFVDNTAGLGLWYEREGQEISFIRDYSQNYELNDETPYRVRFQVYQLTASTTQLRAKLWPLGDPEPTEWHVEHVDDYAPLQNTAGHFLVDSWSTQQSGDIIPATRLDDIEIKQLCNPLLGISSLQTLESSFEFAEGPVWREDHLLFSDITANTIYRWDDTLGLQVHNANSGNSNGLNLALDGSLLAAENTLRRVSINDGSGSITLLDSYQGNQFNSPNDLVMSNLGILYFTDPDYGLTGRPRELPFNGIFRYHPSTGLLLEYMGDQFDNKPNGINLSPDQQTLYWNDSQAGHLNQMSINPDGSLSNLIQLADNLTIPDGMCVDKNGNIYVATWNAAIEVFSPEGYHWGSIPTFENSTTNCTFGGEDLNTLFITTRTAIHRIMMNP